MKIKNLVFCGFMGSILAIGAATAAAPDVTIADTDATTLATAKYVKQGVNYALHHAGDNVSVASGSALTKSAVGTDGTYTLGLTMATTDTNGKLTGTGLVTGNQVAAAIDAVNGAAEALEERMDAAEGDIEALEEVVGNSESGLVKALADEVNRATAAEEVNATAITAEENRAKGIEEGLDTRLTAAEYDIDALETADTAFDTRLTADEGSIAQNTSNITGLTTRMSAAETDIDTLESGKADKATTLEGYGITDAYTKTEADAAIKTQAAGADYANTSSGLSATSIQGAIDEVEGRVDTLETKTTGTITVKDGNGAAITNIVSAINQLEADKLTGSTSVGISDGVVSATMKTKGGVVDNGNGIELDGTGTGVMYNGTNGWERLAITSSDFPN